MTIQKKYVFSYLLLIISLMTVGCASSKLELELSIYKEDPTYKGVITNADLKPAEEYLADIKKNVKSIAKIQKTLADDLYNAFAVYWLEDGRAIAQKKRITFDRTIQARHMSALSILDQQREAYKAKLDLLAIDVEQYLVLAQKATARLKEVLPENASKIDFSSNDHAARVKENRLKQELNLALGDVDRSFKSLVSMKNEPYQKSLEQRWEKLAQRAASDQFKSQLVDQASFDKINNKIKMVANNILNTTNTALKINGQLEKQLKYAVKQGSLETMTSALAENPMVYELSAEEESKRLQAFDMLNSQLERLQNPGSPVWRIVTDPENAKKWNTEFSRTYFYAEGNSGVVVVRDSPMDYRVQEGANNPAALVQAQLQVSRAVADAAIQIAGASTGVPLVGATLKNQTISKADNSKYVEETESLVQKKAELEGRMERRALSVRSMTANLQSTLKQLKDLDPSIPTEKPKIDNLRDDLVNSLKSQKSYFNAD